MANFILTLQRLQSEKAFGVSAISVCCTLPPHHPPTPNMLSLSRKPFFTMISSSVSLIQTSCYLYLLTTLSLFLELLFYLLLYVYFHQNLSMFSVLDVKIKEEQYFISELWQCKHLTLKQNQNKAVYNTCFFKNNTLKWLVFLKFDLLVLTSDCISVHKQFCQLKVRTNLLT